MEETAKRLMDTKVRSQVEITDEERDAETMLWGFSARQLQAAWRQAVQELGLAAMHETLYQDRHGGASRDKALKLRSDLEIQGRGRWATASSRKIYEKAGRLQELHAKTHPEVIAYGQLVRQNYNQWWRDGCVPPPPRIG